MYTTKYSETEKGDMYEFAIRGAKLGLWDWDLSTGTISHNKRWAEILGFENETKEHDLESWESLVHPDDKEEVLNKLNFHLNGGSELYSAEYRIKTKNGNWIWILDTGMVVEEDAQGKPLRMSGIHCDITLQKEAEKNFQEARKLSEEIDRVKTITLRNISHEFKTPLIGILGFSDILLEEVKNPEQLEMIKMINASALELNLKLDQVINLLKIENREYKPKPQKINLLNIVEKKVKYFRPKSLEKNLFIDLIVINHNQIINSDEQLIRILLKSIIDNSIKFTDSGGIKITLDRVEENGKSFSVIEIKDTGIGIPQKNLDHIFGEFRQADERLNKRYNGTGLGLSIAHKIICLLDGKIEIYSDVGLGTKFIVKLPSII
ncbi:PAS domain S-box protein [Ignavibacteria bacterium CHB1]|nr:MAG: PAS domain S-box protein [Chlorobiota bacterium]MBV6398078.1 Sensor histidine kinase RcsC [Ignavibacteria bacterium]MCC6886527.1 PAS domain-containing sensor histidine kinase [Ignavibacteriales bacterium]MCE7952397.1 PAS domain S-box protein [Chlorobi bacterium CHB7]MDL1886514.1 PAS domain S-box protein [Ignavibacteria bacterium CHB1]RIK48964.1 MAG: hypothetical protein DCC60_05135 [Ignavibacteriota bacterium]